MMVVELDPDAFDLRWRRQRLWDSYAEFRERRPWRWLPSWLRARVFAWWFLPADMEEAEVARRIQHRQLRERNNG